MEQTNSVILIPAFKPDARLPVLVEELQTLGIEQIVVVDDGSGPAYTPIFEAVARLGCQVERYGQNMGKGAALKTGIQAIKQRYGSQVGCVTADADGQHRPGDILKIARELARHPEALVLGVRDFTQAQVPPRSRIGNRVSSLFFRLVNGVPCQDTQTGLRGIPAGLMELALSEEGSRYNYEMNFLMDAVRQAPLRQVTIETVYENRNETSHFRPIRDSLLVYQRFLRFTAASLAGAAVDYGLFYIFMLLLAFPQAETAFLATVLARLGSGTANFLLNRHWCFRSQMPAGRESVRYLLLFVGQMLLSAGLVALLSLLWFPPILAKVLVDVVLFFISFRLQKNWVFRQEGKSPR